MEKICKVKVAQNIGHMPLLIIICHKRSWLLVTCFEFVWIDPYANETYKPIINVFIRLYKMHAQNIYGCLIGISPSMSIDSSVSSAHRNSLIAIIQSLILR